MLKEHLSTLSQNENYYSTNIDELAQIGAKAILERALQMKSNNIFNTARKRALMAITWWFETANPKNKRSL